VTKVVCEVLSNRQIAKLFYTMELTCETAAATRPGQFVNIALEGFYLRRPFSVSDWDDEKINIIYKVSGRGTAKMSGFSGGEKLDVLTGLGNGYDLEAAKGKRVLIVGGGAGVPPLIGLTRRLLEKGGHIEAVLGFNDAESVIGKETFEALRLKTGIATVDGSVGFEGTVVDLMSRADFDYYYACGAMQMLSAVHALGKEGQLSFEARMACGFGACMGCSCKTLSGHKRICTDGPVFYSREVSFGAV